jgi:SAM-dependent methyltransferase
MAKKMGFDVCGIEPSPRSIGHARRTLGNDVYQIDIQNIDSVRALDGKFDIIALWHVLEHIADPTALMDHIKNRLAPSGVVLIAVPNMASYQSQWGKADWYHLDPPRHIHHYSPKSLQMLLAKHGFKIDKKYSNSFYQNYIGEVMTVLNKLLPIKNIILNMLKRNRNVLKKHGAARTATIFIQAAIVVSVLSVPLLLWTIYTQLRGKAGTMVFIVQQ